VTGITEKLADLRAEICTAANAAGRDPDAVRILAVSKRHDVSRIRAAIDSGLTDFGENYLQEALEKTDRVTGVNWHFIGRIQSNKTRAIAEHFDWVQTVASRRIAERLSAQRPVDIAPLQVCIQLQPVGGERGGIPETELDALAACIAELPGLELRGLMIMPLPDRSDTQLQAEFAAGRGQFERLIDAGHALDTLSMGMSEDLAIAVAEGSTMLRIGTRLFGPRPG
jgi:pyridoxal phosphate enzyme (YggS family)